MRSPTPPPVTLPPPGERPDNRRAMALRLLEEVALGTLTLIVAAAVLFPSFVVIHLLFVEGLGLTLAVVGGFGVAFTLYLAYRSGLILRR